jgi:hypothetical protein
MDYIEAIMKLEEPKQSKALMALAELSDEFMNPCYDQSKIDKAEQKLMKLIGEPI